MKVAQVTQEDGKACAYLLNFLKAGRWDLNGSEAEELVRVKLWVGTLAQAMAADLSPNRAPPSPVPAASPAPAAGFKVKAMGKLPVAKTKPRKKK